ncbi:MAG TPA: 23S rRNA (guanosine(2251)-2'-O)-methyltransferase RlmB [Stellaceae bacterium]|nr:23S rRNA (guanosine(2251)-2'-O)-methyltransferase RlmB [Stellaceae bacterium]
MGDGRGRGRRKRRRSERFGPAAGGRPVPAQAAIAAPEAAPRPASGARRAKRAKAPPRPRSHEESAWIYGRHAVAAALANPRRRIRRLASLPEAAPGLRTLLAEALAELPAAGPEILERDVFAGLLPEDAVHQGVALLADPLAEPLLDDVLERLEGAAPEGAATQAVILLDQVTDPHNVGAVLRSAAAFGALAVILPEHGAPPVTGALAKAASGALEHVPLLRVVNLARAMDRLKAAGFWCAGLDEAAERSLPELRLSGRLALVLGAEGAGMRRLTRERCDLLARLPTRGAITSLNVSNAAAIALYELNRGMGS